MKDLSKAIRLTIVLILFFGVCYPLFIWGIGRIMPDRSSGLPIIQNGKLIGYENIGQRFTDDKYLWGRPSAVEYNAASSGAGNQGPTNPEHIALVKTRIDSFLAHNPDITAADIPSELVTASGSGLDPHISPRSAYIQIPRIARTRKINEQTLRTLIDSLTEHPLLGIFGTERVNVVKVNIALDQLQ
jgi:K+-transporting ATPase ATPase C chain